MARHTQLLLCSLVAVLGAGCSLVVGFDRDRINDGGTTSDSGMLDGGPRDAGPDDAAMTDAGPECGNGVMNAGEACDDGNTSSGDGCSATCTVEPGFECEGFGPDSCSAICGDGMVVGDEVCDDGFTTPCGACNADCTAAGTGSTCGDGVICTDTERCDDMNTMSADGCSGDCTMIETGWVCMGEPSMCAETCGNGVLDAGETCDDDGNEDDDGCSADCQEEPGWSCAGEPSVCETTCGDGIRAGMEGCDDGNTSAEEDGCSDVCAVQPGWMCTENAAGRSTCMTVCGDGMVRGTEVCDDGNTVTETACPYGTAMCTLCRADCGAELMLTGNVCGDGNRDPREVCDDGNMMPNDGCDATCMEEAGWDCTDGLGVMSVCSTICGDGLVRGMEQCDRGIQPPTTGMGCNNMCRRQTGWYCSGEPSVCTTMCGDRIVAVGSTEVCDDGNNNDCGTCSAGCTAVRTLTPAMGSITVTAAQSGFDGEQVRLRDGAGGDIRFQIDITGVGAACTDTANVRCVAPMAADASAQTVAVRMFDAIEAARMAGVLGIRATDPAGGTTIALTNTARPDGMSSGALGNINIVIDADLTGWSRVGMANGVARDCAAGTGCNGNDVCGSVSCSATNTCN